MGSDSLSDQNGGTIMAAAAPSLCKLQKIVRAAHDDDIHGMQKVSDSSFITGSKDGAVRLFSTAEEGFREISPKLEDYTKWITALLTFPDETFVSGSRDGVLTWKKIDKTTLFSAQLAGGKADYAKERNISRVTSLTALPVADSSLHQIILGFPGGFIEYDLDKERACPIHRFKDDQWAYGAIPLSRTALLMIRGCLLGQFTKRDDVWSYRCPVIKEERISGQRPFISSIARIGSSAIGAALFDGRVKVVDLETTKPMKDTVAHEGRVWQVTPLTEHIYASCADDRTIKIWDLRTSSATQTLAGHPGRVSSLLSLSPSLLIAGTCPDRGKADLYYYDLKK